MIVGQDKHPMRKEAQNMTNDIHPGHLSTYGRDYT